MPLAPPLRSGGVEVIIALLLGAWNRPKPKPHTARRQPMSSEEGASGKVRRSMKPRAKTARPMPPRWPGE
jgi:hypothetical protein